MKTNKKRIILNKDEIINKIIQNINKRRGKYRNKNFLICERTLKIKL